MSESDNDRRLDRIERDLYDPEVGIVPIVTIMRTQLEAQYALLKYGIPTGLTILSLILVSIWGVHTL